MSLLTKYPYVIVVPARTIMTAMFGSKLLSVDNQGLYFLVDYIVRTHQEYTNTSGQKFKVQDNQIDPITLLCRSHLFTALQQQGIPLDSLQAMDETHPITVHSANLSAWEFYKESLAKKCE